MRTVWTATIALEDGTRVCISLDDDALVDEHADEQVLDASYVTEPTRFTVGFIRRVYDLYKAHGEPVLAFINNVFNHNEDDFESLFTERFQGVFFDLNDYAMYIWDVQGILAGVKALGLSETYLNAEAFGRDLYLGGDIKYGRLLDRSETDFGCIAVFTTR